MDFSSGINVLIGENGVGKTHLIKVLYYAASLKETVESPPINRINDPSLDLVFGIDDHQKLVRLKEGFKQAVIDVSFGSDSGYAKDTTGMHLEIKFDNEISPKGLKYGPLAGYAGKFNTDKKPLYIPVTEMLSWYEGFQSLYQKREISFDKTYYDLAVALGLPKLKGGLLEEAQELADEISQVIKADVFQKDGKFYFRFHNTEDDSEASVVAQGINKLGQLYYLILNGTLNKDTILFWDEPEAGLNPKYIRVLANILQTLANAGVQIFIPTHDYLLAHQLSLMAEYRDTADAVVPDMKFFALYQTNEQEGTVVESGSTLADIQHNTILEEFSSFYDMEQGLFQQPVKQ